MAKEKNNKELNEVPVRSDSWKDSEEKMLAYYVLGYHGSVYVCHWLGGHSTTETLGWMKDGWYRGCIPRFFQKGVFQKLQEHKWFRACLEIDGYSFDDMRKRVPDFLEELKKWVNTGRLEISDGTYSQPYSFIISGESNIRQYQYGMEATKQALGVNIKYHVQQEAGFHPQLPQIFKGMNYEGVVLRIHWGHWGWPLPIREHKIFWEGLDGTKIEAIPPYGADPPYASPFPWDPNLEKKVGEMKEWNIKYPLVSWVPDVCFEVWSWRYARETVDDIYLPDMYKNIGLDEKVVMAAATKILDSRVDEWGSRSIEKIFSKKGLKFCTPEEYFKSTPGPKKKVFIPNEDFEYRHIYGMYADRLTIKNKEAENKLYKAEVLSALCYVLGGPNFSENLVKAWKLALCGQNHDVYCIPNAFMWAIAQCPMRRGLEDSNQSIKITNEVSDKSLGQICSQINTRLLKRDKNYVPVIVFNTLSWARTEPVEVEVSFIPGTARSFAIFDGKKEIPSQIIEQETNQDESFSKVKIIFIAEDIPSIGYRLYYLVYRQKKAKRRYETDLQVNKTAVENQKLKVRFTSSGYMESVLDKVSGEEFLDSTVYYGNEFTAVFPNLGFKKSSEFETRLEIVEKGPVRATLKMSGKFGGYDYTTFTHIYSRARRIDFDTIFDFDCQTRIGNQSHSVSWPPPSDGAWNSHDKLRVVFSPKIENGHVFADMPFAAYPWKKNTILGYNWADCSNGKKGLSLINTGNIGYYRDSVKNVGLSLILAYGGPFRGKGPTYLFEVNRFRYALYPHVGDWKAGKSYQRAFEVNNPLLAVPTMVHGGELGQEKSFVQVEPANAVLSALIPGEELMMRLFEMEGGECAVAIKLGLPVKKASEANLLGEELRKLKFTNNTVREKLKPHKILTIKLGIR